MPLAFKEAETLQDRHPAYATPCLKFKGKWGMAMMGLFMCNSLCLKCCLPSSSPGSSFSIVRPPLKSSPLREASPRPLYLNKAPAAIIPHPAHFFQGIHHECILHLFCDYFIDVSRPHSLPPRRPEVPQRQRFYLFPPPLYSHCQGHC